MERIIVDTRFNADNFNEWKNDLLLSQEDNGIFYNEDEEDERDLIETYCKDLQFWAQDEKENLNKEIDGVIVAFADLGFWNGRRIGGKIFNNNISSIVDYCNCDDLKLYCDRYNVKGDLFHHDGTHHLTYRVAKRYDITNDFMQRAESGILTYEYFMKHTKSLLPYVKKIYGW